MAIVNQLNDTVGAANTQNVTRSITVPGSLVNSILIVLVECEDDGANHTTDGVISGVTFNGVALSKLRSDQGGDGSSIGRSEIWYLVNPTATTANVVVSRGGSTTGVEVTSLVYSGVNQATPWNANNGANASSGTSWAVSVVSTIANCLLVGNTGATTGVGTGPDGAQTNLQFNTNNGFSKGVSSKAAVAAGSQTLTWTGNTSRWGASGGMLAPAVDGPANLKSKNGLAKASIKSMNGLAIGSVKSVNGLA